LSGFLTVVKRFVSKSPFLSVFSLFISPKKAAFPANIAHTRFSPLSGTVIAKSLVSVCVFGGKALGETMNRREQQVEKSFRVRRRRPPFSPAGEALDAQF
jgi:hypothetical protein